jgi:lipopolysaccharide transport system permease protein
VSSIEQPSVAMRPPVAETGSGAAVPRESNHADTPWLEVRPSAGWAPLRLDELWSYRQLVYFFAWRDLAVRYRQTLLGAAWAILQPLATMLVFTFFFGTLARIPSDGVPYAVWSYCGLIAWQYVSFVVTQAGASLVVNQNLLKKVFFPRLTIPLSIAATGLVDLAIATVVLFPLMYAYGVPLTFKVLWLAPLALLASIAALGVGLWAAALNVKYRDVRYVIPFLMQFWMFVSPVVYPASMVPQTYEVGGFVLPLRTLYGLNPVVSVVEGFRRALLDVSAAPGPEFWLSVAVALAMFVSGLYYFRRIERQFADIV